MKYLLFIPFLLLNNFVTSLFDDQKKMIREAETLFNNNNFLEALPIYLTLERSAPDNIDFKYKIGICFLYKTDSKQMSINYLEKVHSSDPKTKDIDYYLGMAYHKNYRFDMALTYLNKAADAKGLSTERKQEIELLLSNCRNGKIMMKDPVDVIIKNIGPPINSSGSEYVPVISADESVLIFTYKGAKSIGGFRDEYGRPDPKGKYCEDIYLSYKTGDSWLEPEKNKMFYATVFSNNIKEGINTSGHDASIALSADGQKLFVYKDTDIGSGDIYMSERVGNDWTYPIKLNININSDYWEGSASLSADETTLYFSSEKPGGLGGKDIYKSVKREDGIWDEAQNLGAKINTHLDEDAPFIHPDGKTLYFSSKGHNSMGGYDIFVSELNENKTWKTPENIGYPINTTADDIYYVVTADGSKGYYSSGRLGGYGQQDIYTVNLNKSVKKHAMMMVHGKVTANDMLAEAEIKTIHGIFKSNASTGEYIINLPPGQIFELSFEVPGMPGYKDQINTIGIDSFTEKTLNVYLYSEKFNPQLTVEGTVLYSETPTKPAGEITIIASCLETGFFDKTTTNQKGYFRFINLPAKQHYIFTLDQNDSDLIAGIDPLIIGFIQHTGKPVGGLAINDILTNEDGGLRLGKGGDGPGKYENLPSMIPSLDTLFQSDPELYSEIMKRFGSKSADDLVFKVQIGAYYKPENFDYSALHDLGEAEIQVLTDGITRFTMGSFSTLDEAESFKRKVIQRDAVDAFTLIFYKGERKYLPEAIVNNFFQQ